MTTTTQPITEPGVYPGLSFEQYLEIRAMNFSTLKWALKSAAHLKAAMDGRLDRESKAMAFGRAFHLAMLEPDKYQTDVNIAEPCCATLASGKRKGDQCGAPGMVRDVTSWFCGSHSGPHEEPENRISKSDAASIEAMKATVMSHNVVHLLRRDKHFECVIVFYIDDVLCKAKLDAFFPDPKPWPTTVLDLKKTRQGKAEQDQWSRELANYMYPMQSAFYAKAAESRVNGKASFLWLCVEEDEPHEVGVYRAGEATMVAGNNCVMTALSIYKQSMKTGEWPGYCTDILDIDAADWWLKRWGA